jgi:hypothetical protein
LLKYYTAEHTTPRRWRLAVKTEDDAVEEVVANVQGIISQKDLPPFLEKAK